jgi:hypothetical protein
MKMEIQVSKKLAFEHMVLKTAHTLIMQVWLKVK